MVKRNIAVVILLSFVTFGIYQFIWLIKTKDEINKVAGTKIPSGILVLIPFVNFWWLWKYSQGADTATRGSASAIGAFLLLVMLGFIGIAVLQSTYNSTADYALPEARIA